MAEGLPPVEDQIRTAYADAGMQRDTPFYSNGDRCLSFLASDFVTPDEAKRLIKVIGQYNAFDPETAGEALEDIKSTDENALVAVGREGSPVLYIETDEPDDVIEAFSLYRDNGQDRPFNNGSADEVGVIEDHQTIGPRKYYTKEWDNYDAHSMCSHEEPPIPDDAIAEPDPDRDVVRVWWD